MDKLNNFMTVKEISNLLNVSDETVKRIIRVIYPGKMESRKMTKLSKAEAELIIGEVRIEIKRNLTQNVPDLTQNVPDLENRINKLENAVIDMANGIKLLSASMQQMANSIQIMAKNNEIAAPKERVLLPDNEEYFTVLDFCMKNSIEYEHSTEKKFKLKFRELTKIEEIPVKMTSRAGYAYKLYPASILWKIFSEIV